MNMFSCISRLRTSEIISFGYFILCYLCLSRNSFELLYLHYYYRHKIEILLVGPGISYKVEVLLFKLCFGWNRNGFRTSFKKTQVKYREDRNEFFLHCGCLWTYAPILFLLLLVPGQECMGYICRPHSNLQLVYNWDKNGSLIITASII